MAEPTTTFSDWLLTHRAGGLDRELDAALMQVVQGVMMYSKAGRITVTLAIEPNGATVTVTDNVVVKEPLPDRETALYFPTRSGRLSRRPEDGSTMFDLPVQASKAEGPPAGVNPETGEIDG